ncbi:FGFR1 oncogene partner [Trichoplax sp. H2]|uniref:FGFR1 oncogene partner (FOP) N-terminal dimerisation domain-containing protein n=1 Tax=Trichoplax adhaerens TaxID=10228 RepID=B3RY43_TRIAD|nr:hypothetical protein TRIADDRAFT_56432 [Trichoplax adhaerens]EDV24535.1 hypothetical protein TRIADDRAFT_56432 [Trichoplax adhaerens]RDD38942.1 FGFR1 oncogene partner [Trichoplax sp. H2]|eukprot:XP_002112425.1 hypothetical protein TRIADDRAFT_56432 [Trichoplax adhaerens]
MANDEDTELRDLVAQILERKGVLGKIRAQMRANVFLALEEHDSKENQSRSVNPKLRSFLSTADGRLTFQLVRELFDFFELEYTQIVLQPEANLTEQHFSSREMIARELNIIDSEPSSEPLITKVIRRIPESPISPKRTSSITDDGSGSIDKNELRSLFVDLFPHFNSHMLERYVSDEFTATDNDFSSSIEFNEFLSMYKRLFILCKAKISQDVADIVGPLSPNKGRFGMLEMGVEKQKSLDNAKMPNETSRMHDEVVAPGISNKGEAEFISKDPPSSSEESGTKRSDTHEYEEPAIDGKSRNAGSAFTLPALPTKNNQVGEVNADWSDLSDIDRKINQLGFDVPNDGDDYEDDFVPSSSNTSKSLEDNSIAEEIEEDITEGSQDSKNISTTDQTVTPTPDDLDYMESAILSN